MPGNKTFIEITNQDIYDEVRTCSTHYSKIEEHLATLNGSTKTQSKDINLNRKAIFGAYSTILVLSLAIMGFIFYLV